MKSGATTVSILRMPVCSPTHKAYVVRLLRNHTHKPVCAIDDGGNDCECDAGSQLGGGAGGQGGEAGLSGSCFCVPMERK